MNKYAKKLFFSLSFVIVGMALLAGSKSNLYQVSAQSSCTVSNPSTSGCITVSSGCSGQFINQNVYWEDAAPGTQDSQCPTNQNGEPTSFETSQTYCPRDFKSCGKCVQIDFQQPSTGGVYGAAQYTGDCGGGTPNCGQPCGRDSQNRLTCGSGTVCAGNETDGGICVDPFCNSNPTLCQPDLCTRLPETTPTPSPTPTDEPTPTPTAGPQCLSLTMTPPQPKYGELMTFTCGTVPNVNQYKFRIRTPDGTILERDGSATQPNVAQPGVQARWIGDYTAQCTICPGGVCLPFEDLPSSGGTL